TITYRGASANLSELQNERTNQMQQQQGSRLVQYRGATGPEGTQPHQTKEVEITYRGETGTFNR
ncbi:MAG: hypothetical protein AAGH89_01230, partial [Verrucomicrobiota bacterium]